MNTKIKIVDILLDSLPFIKTFQGKIIVIKYGGSAQINPKLKEEFARDIAMMCMLGIKPIIVHGGGKDISKMLDRLQIKSEFIQGQRLTTQESMPIAEMVLSGNINKELTNFLNYHGIKAVGISGKDGGLFQAYNQDCKNYTGNITKVDISLLQTLLENSFIPVISPIASSFIKDHLGYNINADIVACEVAKTLKAFKIIFLTDTKGVLDHDNNLIPTLNADQIKKLIDKEVITGGMLPKINSCLECIKNGVDKAHIIDGRLEHALLLELFTTKGIGTEITL